MICAFILGEEEFELPIFRHYITVAVHKSSLIQFFFIYVLQEVGSIIGKVRLMLLCIMTGFFIISKLCGSNQLSCLAEGRNSEEDTRTSRCNRVEMGSQSYSCQLDGFQM